MKRRVKTISKAGRTVARVAVGSVRELRRALTVEGDIRSDVEFQNDVNAILAVVGKLTALGPHAASDNANSDNADGIDLESEDVSIEVTPLPEAVTPRPVARSARAGALTPPPARVRRSRHP